MSAIFEAIPTSITSNDWSLVHIKLSFSISVLLFFISFPFYASRKSSWDVISAIRAIRVIRLWILVEFILISIIIYYLSTRGPPISASDFLSYGNIISNVQYLTGGWVFGFGKPICAVVFIGVGILGEMHPATRILCLVGCGIEVFGASLAAYEVQDLITQIQTNGTTSKTYTVSILQVYYWVNILSIAISTQILLISSYLCCLLGYINYELVLNTL